MNLVKSLYATFFIYLARIWILISHLFVPPGKRAVKLLQLPDFQMMVFANEAVGRRIWLFKSYEREEIKFLEKNVKADDTFFDLGGNVGYFSLNFAKWATDGHVHVFEPIPLNAALIKTNLALNGMRNATVNNVAVGTTVGKAVFSVSVDSAYSSFNATGRNPEMNSIEVDVITLDTYIANNTVARVDVLKMDVEGAEGLVLDGGKNFFSNPKVRPRLMLIELFDENLLPFGHNTAQLISLLEGYSYQAKVLGPDGRLQPYSAGLKHIYNVFFVLADEEQRPRREKSN